MQTSGTPEKIIDNASYITDVAWNSINDLITSIIARLPYLAAGFLVLVVFYVSARIVKGLFWAATRRTKLDGRLRILFSRLIVVFLTAVGVLTAFTVVVPSFSFGNLIAGFGLTSVVIGFAIKDIINNLLSGIMILWHQPFQIGDYLFLGNHQGKVEFIGVRATSLRKDDGEMILIPNGDMYSSSLTVRGAGAKRRMNLKFSIGYDDDVSKAKELTSDALHSLDCILNEPPLNVFITDLNSSGVNITVNFWINTDENRPREAFDAAASEVMKSLRDAGIDLFPPDSIIVQRASGSVEEGDSRGEADRSMAAE